MKNKNKTFFYKQADSGQTAYFAYSAVFYCSIELSIFLQFSRTTRSNKIREMPHVQLKLSSHDQQVLESIFNPLELSGIASNNFDIPTEEQLKDLEPETEFLPASIELELEAVRLTEKGEFDKALLQFDKALKLTERASIYNNRAQTLRLAKRDQEALSDLNRALELTTKQQLRTKCHAHCQRGVLHRKLENLDAARADFEAASELGSKFAKEQLVEINPFAALCNQMLRQAFDQLK